MDDFEMKLGKLIAGETDADPAQMIEAMETYIAMLDSKQERDLTGASASTNLH